MAELDLLIKFNRGLCLSLIEEKPVEALQIYRQYVSYLNADYSEENKKELKIIRENFFEKIYKFVSDPKNQDKTNELIPLYQGLLAEFPEKNNLYIFCGKIFRKLNMTDVELEVLLKAEKNDPENTVLKRNLVNTLICTKDFSGALERTKYLIEKEPDDSYNYYLEGMAFDSLYVISNDEMHLNNAIKNMEIAYKKNERSKLYLRALSSLYLKANDNIKLKSVWEKIIKHPDFDYDDKYAYAEYLIHNGNFEEGFEIFESRLNGSRYKDTIVKNLKKYDGKENIQDKTLVIQTELGMGELFLFSRFLNMFKGRAKRTVVRVPSSGYEIIKRSFPDFEIITGDLPQDAEYFMLLMSFAHFFGITKDTIPIRKDYLVSNKEKNERFKKELFNNDKFKIGIAYKGKDGYLTTRNIPLKEFIPLTKIDNVEVYALQYGEEDSLFEGTGIINLAGKIKTFDDTASLIENMDLMITGDNAVMNLAGGLGKKTFCIFNDIPEFRWFDLTGDDVKWYETVKPYQAKKQGEWTPVIQKIAKDIEIITKTKKVNGRGNNYDEIRFID